MAGTFRGRLDEGERLLGTMLTLPSAAAAEILAGAGYDWLFVDGEHGPFETADFLSVLQAVGEQVACVVRVPVGDEVRIKRVLDLGAEGIIVPQVNTAEHAAKIVQWSKYTPMGSRGVGLARAQGYGMKFAEYVQSANERVAVIVQAEHIEAVRNIESIAAVPGIDAVLIGPYDLSASLGVPGKIDAPAVTEAIAHVTKTCLAAGVRLGIFGVTAEAVRPYYERGFTLIVAGVDTVVLGAGARRLLGELRA